MGSECKPNKFHYDLSMSKRTRKPPNLIEEDDKSSFHSCPAAEESSLEFVNGEKEKGSTSFSETQECDHRKSLKDLIEGRSLSQHFSEEEKQLQLIVKQHDPDALKKLKFKRMVSRYAKIFSHLIKLKRKPEMALHKKPVLQLTN